MEMKALEVGFGRDSDLSYDELVEKTEKALQENGFGVLTRIDVKATLKEKLGEEMPPYVILGACNPPLAHRALTAEPGIGLMLPCNVVVREVADGKNRVEVINANAMSMLYPDAGIEDVAAEVTQRLQKVLDTVVPAESA
jgi:uncharacterized protein (DUF302 family)